MLFFNGVDLTGWREVFRRVEKGALVGAGDSTNGTLNCMQKLPGDFEITFSMKLKGTFHMLWGTKGSPASEVLMHNDKTISRSRNTIR